MSASGQLRGHLWAVSRGRCQSLPVEWFGDVEHTHRAIDDALGYAHLLGEWFRRSGARGGV
jgi:hypothetical protein